MQQKELKQDLDSFLNILEKNHPRPFENIAQGSFQQKLTEIANDTTEISDLGLRLQQLVSKIGDSHTQVCLNSTVVGNRCYPLRFKSFEDGTYLIKAIPSKEKYLGMKLKAINNVSIEEIKTLFATLIPKENSTSIDYYFTNFLHEPRILQYFDITKSTEALYILEDKHGETCSLSIEPEDINVELLDIAHNTKYIDETLLQKDIYWTKYFSTDSTYYFQYNSCHEREDFSIEKIIEDIKTKEIKKLVIDLRNNKGGDSGVLEPLIKYLDKLEINTKVFVLVSSDTFSSALTNAIQLSKINNTLLIGDTPHGSPTHFGEILYFTLPNSKLEFQSSTKLFKCSPYKLGDTLNLDIRIKQTFENYISGVDELMKYIRNVLP